jgi:hypothetical protein
MGQCFCWTTQDGLAATAITDMEYPEKAAMILLTKLIMEFKETIMSKMDINAIDKDQAIKFDKME